MSPPSLFSNLPLWLLNTALPGLLLLTLGSVVVWRLRQPVNQIQAIRWTLLGCLTLPLLALTPDWSPWSLRLASPPAATSPVSPPAPQVELTAHFAPLGSDVPQQPVFSEEKTVIGESPSPVPMPAGPSLESPSPDRWVVWFSRNWPAAVAMVYVSGVCLLLLRLGAGWLRLRGLKRSATTAPEPVQEILRELLEPGMSQPKLLVSARVRSPLMWGCFRPVILLPESLIKMDNAEELRFCLAHECTHITRRDYIDWLLAQTAACLFFYLPQVWWLRQRLSLAQDYLADAAASSQSDQPADYADYLLRLSRGRCQPVPLGTLGIGDRRSRLFRRITMLLQSDQPLVATGSRRFTWSIVLGTLVLLCTCSLLRVEADAAEPPTVAQPAEPQAKPAEPQPQAEPITFHGLVTDRSTGKPIQGVEVLFNLQDSRDPKTNRWVDLKLLKPTTDAEGKWQVTIPAELAGRPSLYIEVDARHPNYASKGRSGYALAMILKNQKLGDKPFFEEIKLFPGASVTGLVTDPAGQPLTGAKILSYTKAPTAAGTLDFEFGAFQETTTDQAGRFQVMVHTPGDGVLWVTPDRHTPLAIRLNDKRGDLGTLAAAAGTNVSGQMLDAEGKPVASLWLDIRRTGDGREADEFLSSNAVANHIGRNVRGDDQGRFTCPALPEGAYAIRVYDSGKGDDGQTLYAENPHVFPFRTFQVAKAETEKQVNVQAVPHVVISGRVEDSQGKPTWSHEVSAFGRLKNEFFYARSNSPKKEDGRWELRVPRGLEQTRLDLMTNEHNSLQWRRNAGQPWEHTREITLGTVTENVSDILILRTKAPLLLIQPVDETGKLMTEVKVTVKYLADNIPPGRNEYPSGDVSLEKQTDGSMRTSQMLPDKQVRVTAEKEGYVSATEELSLAEGAERRLKLMLKKQK